MQRPPEDHPTVSVAIPLSGCSSNPKQPLHSLTELGIRKPVRRGNEPRMAIELRQRESEVKETSLLPTSNVGEEMLEETVIGLGQPSELVRWNEEA